MRLSLKTQDTNNTVPIEFHLVLIPLYLIAPLSGDDFVQTHIYIIIIIAHVPSTHNIQIQDDTCYFLLFLSISLLYK